MDDLPNSFIKPNLHSVRSLTNRQKNIAKGHLINSCNKAYGIFPSFSPLNLEFTPGFCITDNFLDCFSFNLVNKKEKDKICAQELNEMVLWISSSPSMALVVTDASIKNNIVKIIDGGLYFIFPFHFYFTFFLFPF